MLDDVFAAADLATLTDAVESAEFETQALGPGGLRSRHRAVIEQESIALLLWERLRAHIPAPTRWSSDTLAHLDPPAGQWTAVGCNPRTRIYRYGLGGSFSPHQDEPWRPRPSTRSMLTVLVYLSEDDCVGGETVVDGEVVSVRNGRVAVFNHDLLHEGKPVERGSKTVLRSDVVFSARAPGTEFQ